MFMESYEEYAKTARVYCSVYAKKHNEEENPKNNNEMKTIKLESAAVSTKQQKYTHGIIQKKKWIKRI